VLTLTLMRLTDLRLIALAATATTLLYCAQGRIFTLHGARMLRPLWPFLLVLALWHGVSGELARGAAISLRLLTAVALANLVTMTTRLDDLIAVLERLAQPLAWLGLKPRVLALALALAIRMTPVLLAKTSILLQAWHARSPRRPGWRVVLPVLLIALDDADHVAEALRARATL